MSSTSNDDKSLGQLESEAERNREVLSEMVGELRDRVGTQAAEMREKVSPAHIKAELADYARTTTKGWVTGIENRIRDNPLQAAAIGAGLAYPLWRIARNIPAPLLLIGAGFALTKPSMSKMADVAAPATGALRNGADALRVKGDAAKRASSTALDQATSTIGDAAASAKSSVADARDGVADAAAHAADLASEKFQGGMDAAGDAADRVTAMAGLGKDAVMSAFNANPLLIAGAGLVLGGLLAAAIPATVVEEKVLGGMAENLKKQAGGLMDQGQEATIRMADAATTAVQEHASKHGLDAVAAKDGVDDLGRKISSVAEAAVDAAKASQEGASAPAREKQS